MIHLLKPESKVCTRCGSVKPLGDFRKDPKGKRGLFCWCKSCEKDYRKKRYEEKKETILLQIANYRKRRKEEMRTLKQREFLQEKIAFQSDPCGGYKIGILNHVRGDERKYNILRTDGRCFCTNSKEEFINFLKERL